MQMSVGSSWGTPEGIPKSTSSPIATTSFIKHKGDTSDKMMQSTSEIEDIDDFLECEDNDEDSSGDDLTENGENSKRRNTETRDKSDTEDAHLKDNEKEERHDSLTNSGDNFRGREQSTKYEAGTSSEEKQDLKLANGEIVVQIANDKSEDITPIGAESNATR